MSGLNTSGAFVCLCMLVQLGHVSRGKHPLHCNLQKASAKKDISKHIPAYGSLLFIASIYCFIFKNGPIKHEHFEKVLVNLQLLLSALTQMFPERCG